MEMFFPPKKKKELCSGTIFASVVVGWCPM
jgi:hypothetical protein